MLIYAQLIIVKTSLASEGTIIKLMFRNINYFLQDSSVLDRHYIDPTNIFERYIGRDNSQFRGILLYHPSPSASDTYPRKAELNNFEHLMRYVSDITLYSHYSIVSEDIVADLYESQ